MIRIVVNLCLTFCFLVEESSGKLNFTRLPGDPWVEDQENGSLPILASCQALSPPSFKQPSWKLPCRKGQFRCADAPPCISMGKRCDGHTDCMNGDDEPFSCSDPWVEDQENGSLPVFASCQALSPPSFKQPSWKLPCRQGQFRCADAPPCISMGKRCDGHTDCINGDDEPSSCKPMDADGTDGDLLDQAIALGREDDRQEEERRKREEEEEEEGDRRRREEEEERREREEEEEMRRKEEERRRRQEEWRREEEEEMRRREEEEEMRRREEESRRKEEGYRRQREEWRRKVEELRRKEKECRGKGIKEIKPYSENESRVERTLYVNTWLLIIILLLLALVLGKRVFKKVSSSWLKATHPKDVQGTRAEDQERTGGIEEDFTTDNTDIMHKSALPLNYDDESPELNQQVCTAETKGACVHRADLPFQVQGDLVVHMNMNTVNMNTMSMNMNTTNNVELQQNGGVTVVGDKTNINYHQPPQ
ncbi:Sortilin-related receptor [Porites harrisoni]